MEKWHRTKIYEISPVSPERGNNRRTKAINNRFLFRIESSPFFFLLWHLDIFHLRTNKDLSAGCSNSCTEFSGSENKYIYINLVVHWPIAIGFSTIAENHQHRHSAKTMHARLVYAVRSFTWQIVVLGESVKIHTRLNSTPCPDTHTKKRSSSSISSSGIKNSTSFWLKLYRYSNGMQSAQNWIVHSKNWIYELCFGVYLLIDCVGVCFGVRLNVIVCSFVPPKSGKVNNNSMVDSDIDLITAFSMEQCALA